MNGASGAFEVVSFERSRMPGLLLFLAEIISERTKAKYINSGLVRYVLRFRSSYPFLVMT